MDSDALNWSITKNPFDFKHKINFVALNVDGRQISAKQLQPDFENAGYIRSYMVLYMPVRERCMKTKEIPSPEMNTVKETPYLDSI